MTDAPSNRRKELTYLSLALLGQLFSIWLVRQTGFTAVSDDDYARVVIAQEFVISPSLDPSGSSWLPLPFLIMGSVMKAFGTSLGVARAAALFTSLVGATLLFFSARRLSVPRLGALLLTWLAAFLPFSSHLAAATVPEYLSAACLVFALASLSSVSDRERPIQAALALACASASRYEYWPLVAALSLFCLYRSLAGTGPHRPSRSTWLIAGLLSAAFPLAWMLYGRLHHGDALFFVARVTDYKAALGDRLPDFTEIIMGYPALLLAASPEIILTSLAAVAWLIYFGQKSAPSALLKSLRLPALLLGLMLSFLLIGAARGGAPTHHAERALLGIWLSLIIYLGSVVAHMTPSRRSSFSLALLPALVLGLAFRLSGPFEVQPFANRQEEESIGHRVRTLLGASADLRVDILTPDFGYFAVLAASGQPERFNILKKNDPRLKEGETVQLLLNSKACLWVGEPELKPPGVGLILPGSRLALGGRGECQKFAQSVRSH